MGGQDRSAGTTGNKERTDGVKSQKSLANIRSGKSAKPSRPTLRAEQVCESWKGICEVPSEMLSESTLGDLLER